MTSPNVSRIAGACAAAVIALNAHADFTGLSVEYTNPFFENHPNPIIHAAFAPPGPALLIDVYRIYANFDANTAADRVNAAGGTPASPFYVNVTGGTFYNYTETDPDENVIHFNLPGVSPVERAWETWVTIGNAYSGGATSLTPDFGDQTNNLGADRASFVTMNAAWFITPDNIQGQAAATGLGQAHAPPGVFRVLLAQLTVSKDAIFEGSMMVNVNGVTLLNQTLAVPVSGVPALLFAPLVRLNRRRPN